MEKQEKLIGTMLTLATFQGLEGKKVTTVEENVEENVKYHQYENGLLVKEYMVGETVFYEVVSKVEYKQEIVQADIPKQNIGLDIFQTVLDVAGLIPVIGEAADGLNGVIYSARGDTLNAALSFGAMIPIAGWASTGGKSAKKGSDLYQARNVVNTEKMASVYTPIYQDVVNSPLGKTQNQLDVLYKTHSQLDTSNGFIFNMPPVKTEIPTTIKSGDVDVKTDIKNVDVEIKDTGKVIQSGNKAETLAKNRDQGRAFEQEQLLEFEKTADNIVEQVTIKTNQGTKIRVDAIGTDKPTGHIVIQEYKSSETAKLTKNQTKGFPELQIDGGIIVGKGKGIFKGSTPIPHTKVEIIRPE